MPLRAEALQHANMPGLQKEYAGKVHLADHHFHARGHSDSSRPADGILMKQKGGAPSATLLEPRQQGRPSLRAVTTPHIVHHRSERHACVRGAIDDKRSTRLEDVKTAKNYVRAALGESRLVSRSRPLAARRTAARSSTSDGVKRAPALKARTSASPWESAVPTWRTKRGTRAPRDDFAPGERCCSRCFTAR